MNTLQSQTIPFQNEFLDQANTNETSGVISVLDADCHNALLHNSKKQHLEEVVNNVIKSARLFCLQSINLHTKYKQNNIQFAGLMVKDLTAIPGLNSCISHLVFCDEQTRDNFQGRWNKALTQS